MILRINDFCCKYDVNVTSINTNVSNNRNGIIAKSIIKGSKRGERLIDEEPIKRRLKFVKKIWLESHDNYYKISEHLSDYKFSKLLYKFLGGSRQGWNEFLKSGLWSLRSGHPFVVNPVVNGMLWKFWRFSTLLIKKLCRLQTKKENRVYKRLPNRDNFPKIYEERGCGNYGL